MHHHLILGDLDTLAIAQAIQNTDCSAGKYHCKGGFVVMLSLCGGIISIAFLITQNFKYTDTGSKKINKK